MTSYQCARCLRKHTFRARAEVWHCPCGCSYKRDNGVIYGWDVNMVEAKRPEWARRERQGTLL